MILWPLVLHLTQSPSPSSFPIPVALGERDNHLHLQDHEVVLAHFPTSMNQSPNSLNSSSISSNLNKTYFNMQSPWQPNNCDLLRTQVHISFWCLLSAEQKGVGQLLLGRENVFTKQFFYGVYRSLTSKCRRVVLFVLSRKNIPNLQGLGRTAQLLREPCSCTAHCHPAELMPQATAKSSMEDPEAPGGYRNSTCSTWTVQVPLGLTQKNHWLEAPSDTPFTWPSTSKGCSETAWEMAPNRFSWNCSKFPN